jgi:hypothetical protein
MRRQAAGQDAARANLIEGLRGSGGRNAERSERRDKKERDARYCA